MHTFLLFFAWPGGGVWSNLIASVICVGAAWWRLRARMIAHHLEVLAQAERHHLAIRARITTCCGAPLWRGRCAGCGHRQPAGGVPPRQTREQPPWTWPGELLGRWQARRAGRELPPGPAAGPAAGTAAGTDSR